MRSELIQKKMAPPTPLWRKSGVILYALLTLLFPLGLVLIRWARSNPLAVEGLYSRGWYHKTATVLTALSGKNYRSWMEIVLILLILAAVVFLLSWVREIRRRRHAWWKICLKRLWIILALASAVFFAFVLTGDLNYYRLPVGDTLGLVTENTDAATLRKLCLLLAEDANTYRTDAAEDAEGVFTSSQSYEELADAASRAVADLDRQHGVQLFSLAGRTHPKAVRCSEVMSYLNITGVIFPYLSEPNVNVHQPDYNIGATMCHELSHVCGFMREDEANFLSYLACLGSENRELRYSGTMLALVYATNRWYGVDRTAWQQVYAVLQEGVIRDLAANSRYWDVYETPVGEAGEAINDAYLKANDQTDGTQSYGRMVDLLIAYYRAECAI